MRWIAFVLTSLLPSLALAIDCPEGAEPRSKQLTEWRDEWCEVDGRKHGPFLSIWVPEEQVRMAGAYQADRRLGVWEMFNREGDRTGRKEFTTGSGSVEQTLWYPNGQARESVTIVDGKRDGLLQRYYEDGVLKEEENYVDGVREGRYRAWSSNGQLQREGQYRSGDEHGLWTTYDAEGEVEKAVVMENGRIVGTRSLEPQRPVTTD